MIAVDGQKGLISCKGGGATRMAAEPPAAVAELVGSGWSLRQQFAFVWVLYLVYHRHRPVETCEHCHDPFEDMPDLEELPQL